MLTRIWAAMRRLEDSWLGDLIGTLCLVGIFWLLMMAVAVLQ